MAGERANVIDAGALARELLEHYTRRRWDDLAAWLAPNCRYQANGSQQWIIEGRHEIIERWRALDTAFPDHREEIVSLVAEGSSAAFELRIRETHTGDLALPFGNIAATGLQIDEVVAYFVEFDDRQQATRIGHYYDGVPLLMAAMSQTTS
jgi:predicted ester cyclase